jgi:hypothetical protein
MSHNPQCCENAKTFGRNSSACEAGKGATAKVAPFVWSSIDLFDVKLSPDTVLAIVAV